MKSKAKITRYRGVTIAEVSVPRFEVRRADGKVFKTFAKLATAKAFVDGVMAVSHVPTKPSA